MKYYTDDASSKVDNRNSYDDEVQPAPGVAEVSHDPHGNQFEAGLEEKYDGEDLVQVVEDVHEHGLGRVPHVLQGHHKAADQDQGKHNSLEILVLYQSNKI